MGVAEDGGGFLPFLLCSLAQVPSAGPKVDAVPRIFSHYGFSSLPGAKPGEGSRRHVRCTGPACCHGDYGKCLSPGDCTHRSTLIPCSEPFVKFQQGSSAALYERRVIHRRLLDAQLRVARQILPGEAFGYIRGVPGLWIRVTWCESGVHSVTHARPHTQVMTRERHHPTRKSSLELP